MAADPRDRRRSLVRVADEPSERVAEVRATRVDAALEAALGGDEHVAEVTAALETLARRLSPGSVARLRSR
jgi:DNA-binding MarR family transcriptional regulator